MRQLRAAVATGGRCRPFRLVLDYLVSTHHGVTAELAVLDELTGGAWKLACLDPDEVRAARDLPGVWRCLGLRDRPQHATRRSAARNRTCTPTAYDWIHSVATVNRSSTSWIGSTPRPGPVGTAI